MKTLTIIFILFVIFIFLYLATKKFIRNIKRKINRFTNQQLGICINDIKHVTSAIENLSSLSEEIVEPKSVSGATSIYLKQIERDFPDYHNSDAETAIKILINEYLLIKYEGMKTFINSNVDVRIIDTIETSNTKQNISDITINKISISNYKKSDEYATIEYQCSVGFNKNAQRVETRYVIKYTLRLTDSSISTKAMTCPNCGATIESTLETHCAYCDAKIIRDTIMSWLFTDIKER